MSESERKVVVFDDGQVSVHGPKGSGFLAVFTGPDRLADAHVCAVSPELLDALARLRDTFGTPRCRVCGEDLGCVDSEGVWACTGNFWENGVRVWKEGRSLVDQHYTDSRVGRTLGGVHVWVDNLVDPLLSQCVEKLS